MIKFKQKLQGLSLIELLIAVTISSLILVGAVTLLVNNKRVYKNQNEMGRVQENTRFAVERLFNDIRLSSYIGCSNAPFEVANVVDPSKDATDSALGDVGEVDGTSSSADAASSVAGDYQLLAGFIGLEGSEGGANWLPSNTADITGLIVANTDGITIRSLANSGATLQTPFMQTVTDNIFVDLPLGSFNVGDIAAISDCTSTDIFKVTAITDTDVNRDGNAATTDNDTRELEHDLTYNYVTDLTKPYNTANTKINRITGRRYYIAAGAKGNSLFMSESDDNADPDYSLELVEGVDDMQIMYGVDSSSDGNPNNYYVAGDANLTSPAHWGNVVSVRITLTFRVVDRDFSDTAIPSRSVTTTVRVRNDG